MRLLFLTDNFPPEVNAPATRTYEHCREWVEQGVEVTVITCAPNFPQGKVYQGYRNRLWQRETVDGIRVIRVWSYIAPNAGFRKRIFDYLSYAFMAFWASLFVKTDLIIATSPQFFTAVSGRWAAWFKRKPWVMEVRDLWPESIRAVGMAKGREKWLDRLERLELSLYRQAQQVVVVTHAFKENISRRGIDPKKIEVVTNGVMLDQFSPQTKDEELVRSLGLEGKFVVAYLGTHGLAHGLDFILDCAPDVPTEVQFLFIGDGARKVELEERVKKERLTNVTMLPPVPKGEIARYISVSDVALVNLRKSDVFKTVIPSKIFENAAMAKPILLGVEGESQAIIDKYEAGLCYQPENKADFLSKLQSLIANAELYADYQAGALFLSRQYDRKQLANSMLEMFRRVV